MTDKHAAKLIERLRRLHDGLTVVGIHASVLIVVADKLQSQGDELEAYRDTEPYQSGYADGRDAAFATGLTGDDD